MTQNQSKNTKLRRINANKRFRKINNNVWIRNYVVRNIKKYWSPEQLVGRIKKKWLNDKSDIQKRIVFMNLFTMEKRFS